MNPNPPHLPVPSYLSSALVTSPEKKTKTSNDKEKQTNKSISQWVLRCVTECHPVYPLAQTALLANVRYNESLVWFEAPDFCYTLSAGATWGLLSDILLLPWVKAILQLWLCLPALIVGAVVSLLLACLVSSCACTGQLGLQAPRGAGSSAAGVWNDCVGSSVFLGCWFSPGRKV